MEIKERVGDRIRAARREAGLSQAALAAAAGLNRVFVGEVELGQKAATVETLEKVARALGLDPGDLVRTDEPRKANPRERLLRRIDALARGFSKEELDRFEGIAASFFRRPAAGRRGARG